MDKFQEAYREASKELPHLSMSAQQAQDESHHQKMMRQRRSYLITRGCTAAAVFFLCGVGTAAAKNYKESVITVGESGYSITSVQEGLESLRQQSGLDSLADAVSFWKAGGAFSAAESIPEEEVVCRDLKVVEYDSLDDFLAEGNVMAVVPDRALFGKEFTFENVSVVEEGRSVHINLMGDDCYFSMDQSDNRGFGSYSSATSYGGESRNERHFTNEQGLSYVMFDTVDESGRVESTHGVISVNGWDLAVTFSGFEEKVIEDVLGSLDLTVYYQE